ncbi:MAG: ECF RNA polymerase sigma factor SigH [Phycisphaerae bacterium]|nr:ECF RNA polymerase sigma factor SigH [Phycisphaerae bacterium]
MDAVYRAAFALCGDAGLADDLLQATYLKAWEQFSRFQAGSNARAWLLRIMANAWIDLLRKRRPAAADPGKLDLRAAREPAADPPPRGDAEAYVEGLSDDRLAAAIRDLPLEYRLAMFLVDVEGLTHAEAAEAMGVAVGTAKSRASRARQMIRERLSGPGDGPGGKQG